MLVCLLLTPPLMRLAVRFNLEDIPDSRKVHTGNIPRVGGLAMIAGTFLSVLLWIESDYATISYLVGVIVIAIFGTWDDKVQLGHRIKFIGQFVAALIVILYGDVKVNYLPFIYEGIIPDIFAIPFTLFALLGITNAINLSDGLDGLAGGSSVLSLGVIALLGFMTGDTGFVLLCLAVIGSILGFLRFNTHPAVIFMGDTGSQFLGFSLGVLVIWLTQEIFTVLSPAIAIIILGLPILDTFYVMTQRILEGKSPFKPDKRHIHHKLLSAGFDHYEAVTCIYLIQSLLVISAYVFRFNNDYLIVSAYILTGICFIFFIEQVIKYNIFSNSKNRISIVSTFFKRDENRSHLTRFCAITAVSLMLAYFFTITFYVKEVPSDVSIIIISLLLVSLISWLFKKNIFSIAHLRLDLYITSTIIIYLCHSSDFLFYDKTVVINALYILFLIITLIGLALPEKRKGNITPLDYIIIFIVVIFASLPHERFVDVSYYSADIGRLFVLFYLSEFILMSVKKNVLLLKTSLMTVLIMIILKSTF